MNRIENELCNLGNTTIPSRLKIEESENRICLILNAERVQKENMQKAGNDFEGWAMAAHICAGKLGINKKIMLDVDQEFVYKKYVGEGHLGRFLYRTMKFSKQYGEFVIQNRHS